MDIATQAEIILRDAQYDTWTWTGVVPAVTCFESAALMGFVHVFGSAEALLQGWEAIQQTTLARHAPALRSAGAKAWNVYSVFLTSDPAPRIDRAVERIEENFALTRKIARDPTMSNARSSHSFRSKQNPYSAPRISRHGFAIG